ncbi:hypothetical protein MKEN_01091100 [Mycena kentingensis (nom. inval.)]|nr:hypothetical protein MKEN_01091100 [Mycena kentingensis (nom. inval.)]
MATATSRGFNSVNWAQAAAATTPTSHASPAASGLSSPSPSNGTNMSTTTTTYPFNTTIPPNQIQLQTRPPTTSVSAPLSGYTSSSGPYPYAHSGSAGFAQDHVPPTLVSPPPPTSPLSPVSVSSGGSYGYNGLNTSASTSPSTTYSVAAAPNANPPFAKEYSIFVGDLAPETSNSDLVAVFRNPVLGLRNDRAPKFIRPFTSCKSAKIMLDPATGVSRGYGFVRFTDEADQQRALIEMHGLYCLSRPMRISPATAKFKPPTELAALSEPAAMLPSSVSAPIAGQYHQQSDTAPAPTPQGYISQHVPAPQPAQPPPPPDATSAEWKHHACARAILGNLVGPNGEQLTSTDPYNTTVFVGGLSPLVGEDTLKSFFIPFGDIHYVKVPVGKHCGFVQFVRKADAEQAIEKMQGFPVAGSRIRLSWGRSQYKAAQAAAQAAALASAPIPPPQPTVAVPTPAPAAVVNGAGLTPQMLAGMSQDQIVKLIQQYGAEGLFSGTAPSNGNANGLAPSQNGHQSSTSAFPQLNMDMDMYRLTNPGSSQPRFTEDAMKPRRDDSPFGFVRRPVYEAILPPNSMFAGLVSEPKSSVSPTQQRSDYNAQDLLAPRHDSYATGLLSHLAPSSFSATNDERGSPPMFQANRYHDPIPTPSRHPISRPISGSAPALSPRTRVPTEEWDARTMQGLNGMLASLDLDQDRERA